jgi:hypothetical protein
LNRFSRRPKAAIISRATASRLVDFQLRSRFVELAAAWDS